MSTHESRFFGNIVQKTHLWLNEIREEMNWEAHDCAYRALRIVLQTLGIHLPLNESAQFASQLPQLIGGNDFKGWNSNCVPSKERHWEQFTANVGEAFLDDLVTQPGENTQSVLKSLSQHVSPEEIDDVKHCLPVGICCHWRMS